VALNSLDLRSAAGLIALQSFRGVGPVTTLRVALTEDFAPLERVAVKPDDLETAYRKAMSQVAQWEQEGLDLLAIFDERYPDRLRQIHEPPPLLWVRGEASVLSREKLVAVIGTREPSTFGVTAAECLTDALAQDGWGIVSGLAKGVDTRAHRQALKSNAPTIAVMGGGLASIYPATNKALAAQIVREGGALVSEQPLKAPPSPQNLIRRDRVQSGLSVGVLVAQTGVVGGSMHTVRYAVEQGKPVLCPDPSASNGKSDGLRALLQTSGRDLCSTLPAWKDAKRLCARLGDEPVAFAIKRGEERDVLIRALELAMTQEPDAADSALRPEPTDDDPYALRV
jgi:DNA processing protein